MNGLFEPNTRRPGESAKDLAARVGLSLQNRISIVISKRYRSNALMLRNALWELSYCDFDAALLSELLCVLTRYARGTFRPGFCLNDLERKWLMKTTEDVAHKLHTRLLQELRLKAPVGPIPPVPDPKLKLKLRLKAQLHAFNAAKKEKL